MDNILLDVKDLKVEYLSDGKVIKAVNGVRFRLERGKTIGLVGETGAGKTTTARSIMRLVQQPPGAYRGGQILFEGLDLMQVSEATMRTIRGKQISMIFQDPMTSLNPVYTVGNQIAEVITLHEKVSPAEAMRRGKRTLETVGIPAERSNEYPHQFSGGMKQRVCIAIALAGNPKLIIADEPTTALDVTIQAQVLNLMKNLKNEFDTAMILITHDLGIVAEVCDTVAIMYAGRIIEFGTLAEIFRSPRHPYTQGLFNAIPALDKKIRRLNPIGGLMPDPANLPEGCAFCPRCAYAAERCWTEQPDYLELNADHAVACFHFAEAAGLNGGMA